MEQLKMTVQNIITQLLRTDISLSSILEIIIIAICMYHIMLWIKNTKAWMLLKGIFVIFVFYVLAKIFELTTILYLAEVSMNVLAVAAVVVFQPEIRRALENLGQKNIFSAITPFDKKREQEKFSVRTVDGIVDACVAMGRVRTGALIVIEKSVRLTEYIVTGIELDCILSSQVLINIFEHNTPLHDGAIVVRGDRILAATCYLPLSDNMNLNKNLGTRHRAAVGMSEVSDALIIAVSEETGNISVAYNGVLKTAITEEMLKEEVMKVRNAESNNERTPFIMKVLKGGKQNEETNSK